MNKKTHYEVKDTLFDEKYGVLKNKQNIQDSEVLEEQETEALLNAYDEAARMYSDTHSFTAEDIRCLHQLFLKDIFVWAGKYRTVDISSTDIRYCHAKFIESEMASYESTILQSLTPFSLAMTKEEIASRMAKIHGELIIIHPFRDGNGRTTRLLCDLLLMQAHHDPLDLEKFYTENFTIQYHKAIQILWKTGDITQLAQHFFSML